MRKTGCFSLDLSVTFLQGHKKVSTLYHEHGSLCGHHKSFSLRSWFQQFARMMKLHKTSCFDHDIFFTFLQDHKKLKLFPFCTMATRLI